MLRKTLTAKIHIAKQQLGMDEESYRALLLRHGGNSCTQLSVAQLEQVITELKQKGFKPKHAKTQGKPKNFYSPSMPMMITKIEALLADMQLPWSYADGIVKQMYGIERCAWVREPAQLKAVIAALHNLQKKTANERPL